VLHGGQLVVAEHRGEFLLRPLGWEDGQWVLEPVRPGEVAIPVQIDDLDASALLAALALEAGDCPELTDFPDAPALLASCARDGQDEQCSMLPLLLRSLRPVEGACCGTCTCGSTRSRRASWSG